MLAKRIIGALDIKNGKVVKGIKFQDVKTIDDPVVLSKKYENDGMDELVFLDIFATNENRDITYNLISRVAENINIPFTVGGGVDSIEKVHKIIRLGADKVFINTFALANPEIIKKVSYEIGSSNLVIAIDAKFNGKYYEVYSNSGSIPKSINVVEWAKTVENYGAGEILLTSIDNDGTKSGYDNELIKIVSENVNIPVIASGGAGSPEDFCSAFKSGADACLAGSVFHYNIYTANEIKNYLKECGLNVRI